MYKVVGVILLGLFLSTGALAFKNGALSLDLQDAKQSIVQAFGSLVKFAEKHQ